MICCTKTNEVLLPIPEATQRLGAGKTAIVNTCQSSYNHLQIVLDYCKIFHSIFTHCMQKHSNHSKSYFILQSFHKNGKLTSYCHTLYLQMHNSPNLADMQYKLQYRSSLGFYIFAIYCNNMAFSYIHICEQKLSCSFIAAFGFVFPTSYTSIYYTVQKEVHS